MFQISTQRAVVSSAYDTLQEELIARFGQPESDCALVAQVRLLRSYIPNPADIEGLRVLDLGCGSVAGTAETDGNRNTWAPWFCRAVTMLGGEAVGVDIGRISAVDTFTFYRRNLLHPDALSDLETASFDLVSCSNLFSSPHLVYRLGQNREQRAELAFRLRADVDRLLKPGGRLLHFDEELDNH